MPDQIRWGVLGGARIAVNAFLPALKDSTTGRLVAVASRDLRKAEEVGKQFGAEHFYGSYDGMLDAGGIDAVYIPLPNHLHKEYTIKAAERGIHVLCEKPLSANETEAALMVEACRKHGVKLMNGFMWKLDPMNQRVIEIIRSGEIGPIRHIRTNFVFVFGPGDNIRLKRETAGGSIMDVGVYCINTMRGLLDQEPVEVMGLSINPRLTDIDVDETFIGTLKFPNGTVGTFISSFGMTGTNGYEVFGEKGMITPPSGPSPPVGMAAWHRRKPATLWITVGGTTREETFGENYPFLNEIDHFAHCIRTGKEPTPNGEDGRLEMRVVDALKESAATGKRVGV
ncbi:MAG: Gfo/Idh/MocA family oxidoreductase [Candidatus Latescibacteria bacterium]|nr:Gfo/Idh/MocA family oxidoreductase [Candidatus Latescibacterota bacterium]